MPENSSPPTFDEKVYALSKIVHQVKFLKNRSDEYTPLQRKHLGLLDDISLLLVTESPSDVAAVSFEQRPTEIIFYYAKNRPATPDERAYIEQLKNIVRASKDSGRIERIFEIVLRTCRSKMLSRLDKLVRVIKTRASDARGIRDDSSGDLHEYLQRKLGAWYVGQTSAVRFVDKFLSYLCNLRKTVPEPAELGKIIRFAHVTGAFKPAKTVYPDGEVEKRIRLLGDYFGAVHRIVRNMDSISGSSTRDIRFEEIRTQQPLTSRMPTNYLTIVNRYATECNVPTISYEALKDAYPAATALDPGDVLRSQRVTLSVHAECIVALFMASLPRSWKFVEIGCSKGSCWLCEQYLATDTRLMFHVSNVHGKLQPGWVMPPGGDPSVEAHIVDVINDGLQEVILRAVGSKRSDSEPRSESDMEDEAMEPPAPSEGTVPWI